MAAPAPVPAWRKGLAEVLARIEGVKAGQAGARAEEGAIREAVGEVRQVFRALGAERSGAAPGPGVTRISGRSGGALIVGRFRA